MEIHERTITVQGKQYYEPSTFALLCKHTVQTIRDLYTHGNYFRKLQVIYLMDKPLIPVDELINFPFTYIGRPKKGQVKEVYHFTTKGELKI